jgi:hypothetical protein
MIITETNVPKNRIDGKIRIFFFLESIIGDYSCKAIYFKGNWNTNKQRWFGTKLGSAVLKQISKLIPGSGKK